MAWVGLLLGLVVLFHVPLLRCVGEFLIYDEPLAAADALIVRKPDDIGEIDRLYKAELVKEVVLIEDRSSRLSRLNIEPTKESDLRRAMSARNLPDAMLTVRAGRFKNDWEAAKELRDWLAQHPTARVIVLANEFDSREAAHITSRLRRSTTPACVSGSRWNRGKWL